MEMQDSNLAYQKKYLDQVKDFFTGVNLYNAHPYKREETKAKIIYKLGSSTLFDFSKNPASDQEVILLVPSLINKSYIFDLKPSRSFAQFLGANNFSTYLISWDNPTIEENEFGLEEYITKRISFYIDYLYQKHQKPVSVIGYCLGGNLALAASILNIEKVKNLGLIATPWNFNSMFNNLKIDNNFLKILENFRFNYSLLPAPIIQLAFSLVEPDRIFKKFIKFSKMDQQGKKAKSFVAIEKWVNDGISITSKTLFDCLDLLNNNITYQGNWKILNKVIIPENFSKPCFIALPINDKLVPISSSQVLIDKFKNKHVEEVNTGHIGLIIGKNAPEKLWLPLKNWLTNI